MNLYRVEVLHRGDLLTSKDVTAQSEAGAKLLVKKTMIEVRCAFTRDQFESGEVTLEAELMERRS